MQDMNADIPAFFAAPKVMEEPNTSPQRRLITPVPAIDMVMIGLSVGLIAMTLIMGVQVFCRYVLGMSLSWSEELTR